MFFRGDRNASRLFYRCIFGLVLAAFFLVDLIFAYSRMRPPEGAKMAQDGVAEGLFQGPGCAETLMIFKVFCASRVRAFEEASGAYGSSKIAQDEAS